MDRYQKDEGCELPEGFTFVLPPAPRIFKLAMFVPAFSVFQDNIYVTFFGLSFQESR